MGREMKAGSAPLWLLAVLLWLNACGGTVIFDQPYQLTPGQKIRVRLNRTLPMLQETSVLWGGMEWGVYDVGRALLYVVEDDPNSSVSIQYLSSELHADVREVFLTWRVFAADYRLEVLIRTPERMKLVEALGKGRSTESSLQASQEAIENTVLHLSKQLKALGRSS